MNADLFPDLPARDNVLTFAGRVITYEDVVRQVAARENTQGLVLAFTKLQMHCLIAELRTLGSWPADGKRTIIGFPYEVV